MENEPPGDASEQADTPPPSRWRRARSGWTAFRRKHTKALIASLAVLALVVGACGYYLYSLNAKLDNIDRFSTDKLDDENRPDPNKGDAVNILLLGSDAGKKIAGESADTSLAEDVDAEEWPNGKYRSDTIMVVHISANRKHVYVVSIPRDTFTMIYDDNGEPTHKNKINAAFSAYGPVGTLSTVEHLTDVRLDHVAIIDWAGFKDLSTAVGGVPVTIPETFYDEKQDVTWKAGKYNLKGEKALQYVRTRHGLLRGDFDRIDRQQNFLRSLMTKVLEAGTLTKPRQFSDTLSAITDHLTVDMDWENGDLRGLALSLRGTKAEDVKFMTVPIAATPTIDKYGSIVELKEDQTAELFGLLRKGQMETYVKKYPDELLGDEDDID
ncbi:LCP family protein [Nocardioides sp. Soil796]|uniref:LCP family protein n=1 Tax=Nocardioides sp. Soil796 TaxID=1736412 RepID=UPI00070E8017|nr:LCP family protein [Nocardioides sp. Soil796]KRF14331.1 hypothetical protein ASH02_08250 [Nocardioides sp. Soil796]